MKNLSIMPREYFVCLRRIRRVVAVLLVLFGCTALPGNGYAQNAVVQAVLFYSPTCGHCHQVITEDLPPLFEKYGEQLNIIGIDVSTEGGQQLYRSAVEQFQIPDDRLGVPCLVVGETILVGSAEIPELFPGIIESGLVGGGIPLPNIPGLEQAMAAAAQESQSSQGSGEVEQQSADSSQPPAESSDLATAMDEAEAPTAITESGTVSDDQSVSARLARDPSGNAIALIVLLGMVGSLVGIGITNTKSMPTNQQRPAKWILPALALVGLVVAAYLSYIEVTHSQAVCGPVGDCNTVQQSAYACLFGVLPVGILGVLGYLAIIAAVFVDRFSKLPWKQYAKIATWVLALFGVLFSIYLTFLEPFIIGATCMWCITSAVIMTSILWLSNAPALAAWQELRTEKSAR